MAKLQAKYPLEKEYLQAVQEVLESIEEVYNQHPEFEAAKIVERIVEPDRIFTFRVTWIDDKGEVQTNTGYRIQFNSAIGPYKGGLRFHKAVTPSMLKFLGFEQTFKNALTTLPMGGAKGGSDFDPVGKSDAEIMRFCQAFMLELWQCIGPDQDIPAGDVGVGGREIGFLYGMYKKLADRQGQHLGRFHPPSGGHRLRCPVFHPAPAGEGRQDPRRQESGPLRLRQCGMGCCDEGYPAGCQGDCHLRP